jgi:iron(III) transport system substrate-binding protein
MVRVMKTIITALLIIAMGGIAAARGTREQAGKNVVVYSSVDEANAKKILDKFTDSTGIKASFVFLSAGPALARIQAESGNPQADVWMGAPSENHIVAQEGKLTVPYTGGGFAGLKASFKDPEGYWRCFYMNPMAFAVNTNVLKRIGAPRPDSWDDLLDPAYKGMIQMPSPQSSGTAYNMLVSLVAMRGEDAAFEYMKKLNPNIQTYTSSGTGPSQGVSVGQCAIAIQFTPAFFEFINNGFPLEVVYPREGVWFEAPAVSILKGAKNPEAAKALVDWLITKPGQDALTEAKTFFYPIIPTAVLGIGMPPFERLATVDVDSKWAADNKKRLVERWVKEVLPAK